MLSPGELQRLAFARVLFHKPKFVVMDEPVSAVGSGAGFELLQLLRRQGIAAIITCQADSVLVSQQELLFRKMIVMQDVDGRISDNTALSIEQTQP